MLVDLLYGQDEQSNAPRAKDANPSKSEGITDMEAHLARPSTSEGKCPTQHGAGFSEERKYKEAFSQSCHEYQLPFFAAGEEAGQAPYIHPSTHVFHIFVNHPASVSSDPCSPPLPQSLRG